MKWWPFGSAGWRRKNGETSGTKNPADWLFTVFGGQKTSAGINVSAATALRCSAVFACVRVVSEDVAKLPLIIYRVRSDGSKIPATKHRLYRLLKSAPNSWQSSYEWREMMQAHLELRGNAYSYIERDGDGNVVELIPLHPNRVAQEIGATGELFYRVMPSSGGFPIDGQFPARDILHLRGMSLDGYQGLSTVSWLRETIGMALAAETHGAAFFGNGARPDILLKGFMNPEQAREARDAWSRNYQGPDKAFRPAFIPGDLSIEKLGMSNKDSQFLELRQFQVGDIARGFRIPPHKIGDLTRATFANIEHQALEYYQDGLMPRLERFEAAMERDLLTDREAEDYEIEFDFTRILRGDIAATMNAIGVGRQWGVLNANDSRRWLNLNPYPGGETYLEPLNMVPVGTPRPEGQGSNDNEESRRLAFLRQTVLNMRRAA